MLDDEKKIYEPGMHNISSEEYHSSEGISRSCLWEMRKSPLHYRESLMKSKKQTKSMLIGSMLHTAILEPHLFIEQYWIEPKLNKRTKADKALFAELAEENKGKIAITVDDYTLVDSISTAIEKNKIAKGLINGSEFEKSIYWDDPETGLLCKTRPDILSTDYIADLKFVEDGEPSSFIGSMYKYGYHIQAAMALDGIDAIGLKKHNNFIFIVVEKSDPLAVAIYELSSESIEFGREQYKYLLKRVKACADAQEWPSYPIQRISLPNYILQRGVDNE